MLDSILLTNCALKTRFPKGNRVCKSQVLALKNQRTSFFLLLLQLKNHDLISIGIGVALGIKKRKRKRKKKKENQRKRETNLIRHWDENRWVWVSSSSTWVWIMFVRFWFRVPIGMSCGAIVGFGFVSFDRWWWRICWVWVWVCRVWVLIGTIVPGFCWFGFEEFAGDGFCVKLESLELDFNGNSSLLCSSYYSKTDSNKLDMLVS